MYDGESEFRLKNGTWARLETWVLSRDLNALSNVLNEYLAFPSLTSDILCQRWSSHFFWRLWRKNVCIIIDICYKQIRYERILSVNFRSFEGNSSEYQDVNCNCSPCLNGGMKCIQLVNPMSKWPISKKKWSTVLAKRLPKICGVGITQSCPIYVEQILG